MSAKRILSDEDKLGGEPFFEGTRIRVSDVKTKYSTQELSIDEILDAYPRLSREDIEKVVK